MSKIIILKDHMGFLVDKLNHYKGIDLDVVKKVFIENGFDVEIYEYEQLVNDGIDTKNCFIIYSSLFNPEYNQYINDLLYALSKESILVPRFEVFKAFDNKGFQELLKRQLDIKSIPALYLSNEQGYEKYANKLKYPTILKTISGAGSMGVFMINNSQEGLELIKKLFKPRGYFLNLVKTHIKKYFFKNKYYPWYDKASVYPGRIVIQDFVPDLQDDWKILVFYDKFYALNRKIRENDFRASGSGKLSYIEPSQEVLDFALDVFKKFDSPVASLDICVSANGCQLIELQGIDFGPYTIMNAPYYYVNNGVSWRRIDEKSDYPIEYATSIVKYIKKGIIN